jgi:hypothetical protein
MRHVIPASPPCIKARATQARGSTVPNPFFPSPPFPSSVKTNRKRLHACVGKILPIGSAGDMDKVFLADWSGGASRQLISDWETFICLNEKRKKECYIVECMCASDKGTC